MAKKSKYVMKQRAICIGMLLSLGIVFNCCAQQNDFPVLKGPYLGQKPPGMTPEIFAPDIISTNMNAAKIAFSPDGKEIFFRLMNYNHSFYTIVFMRQENGVWSKPEVAPFSGRYHDAEPYFS